MDFAELTKRRKSVRQYTGEMPTEEQLNYVMAAAEAAPCNAKGIHISIITNAELMLAAEKAAAAFFGKKEDMSYLYHAPIWILFSAKLADKAPEGMPVTKDMMNGVLYWNIGGILQNMMLAAQNIGLGSCAINTVIVPLASNRELSNKLGIPEGHTALGSIIIGATDYEFPERKFPKNRFEISRI